MGLLLKGVGAFAVAFFATGTLLNLISVYGLGHYSRYLKQTIELLLDTGAQLVLLVVASAMLFAVALLRLRKCKPPVAAAAPLLALSGAVVALAFWLPPTLDIIVSKRPLDQWGTPNPAAAALGVSWSLLVVLSALAGWLVTRSTGTRRSA